jgi:hypothetical protein
MVKSLAEVSASRVTARHPECGSMGNFAGRSAAKVMENAQRDRFAFRHLPRATDRHTRCANRDPDQKEFPAVHTGPSRGHSVGVDPYFTHSAEGPATIPKPS